MVVHEDFSEVLFAELRAFDDPDESDDRGQEGQKERVGQVEGSHDDEG